MWHLYYSCAGICVIHFKLSKGPKPIFGLNHQTLVLREKYIESNYNYTESTVYRTIFNTRRGL